MKKIFIILALVVGFGFFETQKASAAYFSVECGNGCTTSGTSPLFSESELWSPGKFLDRTFSLKNISSSAKEMAIGVSSSTADGKLEKVMTVEIVNTNNSEIIWPKDTLEKFYTQGKISLGTFSPNEIKEFVFKAAMDNGADNGYQNRKSKFDLVLGFWEEPAPSGPTSTPTPAVLGLKTGPVVHLTRELQGGGFSGGIATEAGMTAGVKTQKVCPFWWIVLIGQTVFLGIFYALNRRRKEWIKRWWLMTVATILLAYFIDYYAHTRWYIPSKMCSWEKWLGILLAGAETTLFRKVWFDKMKKLLLSFAFILLFFLLSSSVFAIEIKNKIQVSSSAGFETQERDFQAGERVYVRLPLGSGGDKEKTLKLLDSEKKEVLRQDFEISGGMYSASFIAPNKEGVYYLDIKIDNGQGSVFTSQQNINIGEVTGEAVSSSAESKVEVNVTGRAVKISEIEITPELEIPKEPITFIGKMNFWWRRFLSNLTNWLK